MTVVQVDTTDEMLIAFAWRVVHCATALLMPPLHLAKALDYMEREQHKGV